MDADNGNLLRAEDGLGKALNLVEEISPGTLSDEEYSSYFLSAQHFYELFVDVLMQQKKTAEALGISERSRARSLLRGLLIGELPDAATSDPGLVRRSAALLYRKRSVSSAVKARGAATSQEIDGLLSEYRSIEGQIQRANPQYANLNQPHTLSANEIQGLLQPDTVLLEYSSGKRAQLCLVCFTNGHYRA